MPEFQKFSNLVKADLVALTKPASVTNYNRLELAPRTEDFARALRAEVRDPLWMLCRQWQFGEFIGEDAGTAQQAKILGIHRRATGVTLAGKTSVAYDPAERPLETLVERETLAPDLYLRLQMGRHLEKMLAEKDLDALRPTFRTRYPLAPDLDAADAEATALFRSVRGRVADGYQFWQDVQSGGFAVFAAAQPAVQKPKLKSLAEQFGHWFSRLYDQSAGSVSAWLPEHLEYQFSVDFPADGFAKPQLQAEQYAAGRLDWHAFDARQGGVVVAELADGQVADALGGDAEVGGLFAAARKLQVFMPAPLQFRGMPRPRYWQMEEWQTDFGKVDGSPTGILNLLLAEFGLAYSNDWFVLPYELEINTLCDVLGIAVRDVFGQNIFIGPAADEPESRWQEFAAFHHARLGPTLGGGERNQFYLVPAVGKMLESEAIERVNFMRDEMSNMVWGIEKTVPSQAGGGRTVASTRRDETAPFVPADEESRIRYLLGSVVPDNWIPFIPVHKPVPVGELPREIRLQRARLPQSPGAKGRLLTEVKPTYFIEEEEVTRAGTLVERSFQRTRWLGGRTCLWLGRRKTVGRGEGWNGLLFDRILPIERAGGGG